MRIGKPVCLIVGVKKKTLGAKWARPQTCLRPRFQERGLKSNVWPPTSIRFHYNIDIFRLCRFSMHERRRSEQHKQGCNQHNRFSHRFTSP